MSAVAAPRVLTCVYCGHEYPQDTPAWGSDVLTAHIRACAAHPIRKVERERDLLRAALVGMVESDDPAELKVMEMALRVLPMPEADRAKTINAIHALLATAPVAPAEAPAR